MKRIGIGALLLLIACMVFATGTTETATSTEDATTRFSYYYMADQQPMEDKVFAAVNAELASKYGIAVDFHRLDGSA